MKKLQISSLVDRLLMGSVSSIDELRPADRVKHEYYESVRIDLENLLNSKRRCISWSKKYSQLERSVLNCGLDDFMALTLDAAADCEPICRDVEKLIAVFEPRLKNVKVSLEKETFPLKRGLQFRIQALLLSHGNEVEPITYTASLIPNERLFTISRKTLDNESHA